MVLSSSTRETDVKGWYAEDAVLGILFNEFGSLSDRLDAAEEIIVGRLYEHLFRTFSVKDTLRIKIMSLPLANHEALQRRAPDHLSFLPLPLSMESASAYNPNVKGMQMVRRRIITLLLRTSQSRT